MAEGQGSEYPKCKRGELLCEGNDEFYLNGEETPSVEYLGTEDLYGYSYGFHEKWFDGYCAIIRLEEFPSGGSRVAMLCCRAGDRISFSNGCKGVLNYTHETFGKGDTVDLLAEYASCFYYYEARNL